jgi:hypothetical protein
LSRASFFLLALVFGCRSGTERALGDAAPQAAGLVVDASSSSDGGRQPLDGSADSPPDPDAALAAAIAAARDRLDAADAPVRIEGGSFVLAGDAPGALDGETARIFHRALTAFFNGRFDAHPDRLTTVFFFSARSRYLQFGSDASIGYFKRDEHEIDVDLSGGARYRTTSVHELVHALVASDWDAPLWLDEGLASAYENPSFPAPGEIRALTSGIRLPVLQKALRAEPEAMRVEALFRMTNVEFADVPGSWISARNESLARFVCVFLERRGWLWRFYDEYKRTHTVDRRGIAALRRVTSMSPEEMTPSFLAWAREL